MHTTCFMITQPSRLELARLAIGDFCAQTHPERDLLIVHDGDEAFDATLRAWLDSAPQCKQANAAQQITVHRSVPGQSLGALRNEAVRLARGDLVCQWDDDDRYHPERLALQVKALVDEDADFCFLRDQLHGFVDEGKLTWDDWNLESYPLNFVQGTLLGKREKMPLYPEIRRGEDTGLCLAILEAGHKITRLRHQGWCYIYSFHGGNVWDANHHQAIAQAKQMPEAFVAIRLEQLRARLAEYPNLPRYSQMQAGGIRWAL